MDDKKTYSCRHKNCTKKYISKYSLQRHFLICHNKSKRFTCKACKKYFSSNQILQEHSFIHTNEKPLSCPFEGCLQVFRQSSQLTSHKKTHFNALNMQESPSFIKYVKVRFN